VSDDAPHPTPDATPEADTAADTATDTTTDVQEPTFWRSRTGRLLIVAQVVAVVAVAVVFVVLLRDEPADPNADVETLDVAGIPTEMLESLVVEYENDPTFADQMPGIELVLADRHFTDGAYDRAFEIYAGILEDPNTEEAQYAVALSRVGWIAFVSTGNADAALQTIERSLDIDPANSETLYIKGQIMWCGAGDAITAIDLFEAVLQAEDLPDEVRAQVTDDLEVARQGTPCR
jgi:tetratricopeptide (TPR) repeat protein